MSSKNAGRHWRTACFHGRANHRWLKMTPWLSLATWRQWQLKLMAHWTVWTCLWSWHCSTAWMSASSSRGQRTEKVKIIQVFRFVIEFNLCLKASIKFFEICLFYCTRLPLEYMELLRDGLSVFGCSRSAPGVAFTDREAVCVCGAQSSDGRSALEASWPAGCVSAGLGSVSEGPLPATTRLR